MQIITIYRIATVHKGRHVHFVGYFNRSVSEGSILANIASKATQKNPPAKLKGVNFDNATIERFLFTDRQEAIKKFDALWKGGHELNDQPKLAGLRNGPRYGDRNGGNGKQLQLTEQTATVPTDEVSDAALVLAAATRRIITIGSDKFCIELKRI